jgi:hypothetical protein
MTSQTRELAVSAPIVSLSWAWALAVIAAFGVGLLAQVPEACCEMKIVPTTASPSVLTITIANLNQPLVTLYKSSSEMDFRVRVTTDAGQEANRT